MIEIRTLTEADMERAMKLKVTCWTEELAGRAENTMSVSEELEFWVDWMHTAEEHNDVRLLIGAFEDGQMLGAAFGSFAETFDMPDKGIELNGLWVDPNHRNRGIGLRLVVRILDFYLAQGMESIVIYCPHYAPSNQFYRKFGARVVRQEHQMNGRLLVDVFLGDIALMKQNMERSLRKYWLV